MQSYYRTAGTGIQDFAQITNKQANGIARIPYDRYGNPRHYSRNKQTSAHCDSDMRRYLRNL